MEPTICCDLDQPSEFTQYDFNVGNTQHNQRCSRIPEVTKDKHDLALIDALEDWREAKTAMEYGMACLDDYGPSLIMPTLILNRIVDCARHRKLQSVQDLKRETGWTDTEQFGDEIITLVKQHAVSCTPPFISTLLRNTSSHPFNSPSASPSSSFGPLLAQSPVVPDPIPTAANAA